MKDHVLVCGLGRCGTSMVMQMLEAGGHAVHGTAPDYEPDTISTQGRAALPGTAVKIIDPHQCRHLPDATFAIWLDRDAKQQAISQLRLLNVPENRKTIRAVARSLQDERIAALTRLHCDMRRVQRLYFETVLQEPLRAARAIIAHIERPDLDAIAMARRVHRRDAACLRHPIEWGVMA